MILFLHGAGVDPADLRPGAYPLLRRLHDAAPGIRVSTPVIGAETAEATLDLLDGPLGGAGPDDAVVGHSHGGAMALKWIAERRPGLRLGAFIGCAMPVWGQPDWEYDEFRLPDDTRGAFRGIGRVTLVHAADDGIVDPSHVDLYAGLFDVAEVIRPKAGDHDLDTDEVDGIFAGLAT